MPDTGIQTPLKPPLSVLQIGMEWFGPGSSAGGVARLYTDLFASLPQAGVRMCGLVSGPSHINGFTRGAVQSFAADGASFPARLLGVRRSVMRRLREEHFDLVACHFAAYGAPALGQLRDRPLVQHFHGPWAAESRREGEDRAIVAVKQAMEQFVYRRAERVITLSQVFGDLVSRRYGVAPDRVRVVPGAIDTARYSAACAVPRDAARRQLGWPTDRRILLTIRRLTQRMGLDCMINAMVRIVRAEPAVLLCIGGSGPIAGQLREQAEALGLQDHVRLLGFVPDDDLPLAFRAANINVLPSQTLEGFGLSAAEALAAGTPSMVTPVGGLPEVVGALSPNLIFRSCLVDDLADGVIAALRGDVVLPDAAACRHYADSHFSLALCATRIADVYREVA